MDIDVVDDESIDRLLQASAGLRRSRSPTPRAMLREALEVRFAHSGEVVIRQGDAADGLYLVGSGRLQVILTKDGRRGRHLE